MVLFLTELAPLALARIYRHADRRRAVIHYHHGGDTLTRKTLRSILRSVNWTEADLERLGLL